MSDLNIGTAEAAFADLIWKNEPLTTAQLVKLSNDKFQWKRTTTYTVLKRLCQKELFSLKNGIITSLISKEEYYTTRGEQIIDTAFDGSLPAFIAAFSAKRCLTEKQADEIISLINKFRN